MANESHITTEVLILMRQATEMSHEIFQSMVKSFVENSKTNQKGQTTLGKLKEQSQGKLEDVAFEEEDIGTFKETAAKYDIDYALKCDKSTVPPTWYVCFKQNGKSRAAFDRALEEYTTKSLQKKEKSVTTPEKVKQQSRKIEAKQKEVKEKARDLSLEAKAKYINGERSKNKNKDRGERDEH